MTELLLVSVGSACWLGAATLVGYHFLKRRSRESEAFVRTSAEDAMRIKAKHYRKNN
ncbi:MAG: hypothetical protein NTU57_03390 [Candidatus Aenigmarchaeota archaeon]|nr:hypothetical protein [Candidatus Aenigmarchaeota archaeon]